MPKIYRSMEKDGDGQPLVGDRSGLLGVRVPGDVAPDARGYVVPGTGGMSVAPSLRALPAHLVPLDLAKAGVLRSAAGQLKRRVFSHGDGRFEVGAVAINLALRPTSMTHGNVEPTASMPVLQLQEALAATRAGWRQDES